MTGPGPTSLLLRVRQTSPDYKTGVETLVSGGDVKLDNL